MAANFDESTKTYLKSKLADYLRSKNIDPAASFNCLNPAHPDHQHCMHYEPNAHTVNCVACNARYDIFDLIGKDYGLNTFQERLNKVYEIYIGPIDDGQEQSFAQRPAPMANAALINQALNAQASNVQNVDFGDWDSDSLEDVNAISASDLENFSTFKARPQAPSHNHEFMADKQHFAQRAPQQEELFAAPQELQQASTFDYQEEQAQQAPSFNHGAHNYSPNAQNFVHDEQVAPSFEAQQAQVRPQQPKPSFGAANEAVSFAEPSYKLPSLGSSNKKLSNLNSLSREPFTNMNGGFKGAANIEHIDGPEFADDDFNEVQNFISKQNRNVQDVTIDDSFIDAFDDDGVSAPKGTSFNADPRANGSMAAPVAAAAQFESAPHQFAAPVQERAPHAGFNSPQVAHQSFTNAPQGNQGIAPTPELMPDFISFAAQEGQAHGQQQFNRAAPQFAPQAAPQFAPQDGAPLREQAVPQYAQDPNSNAYNPTLNAPQMRSNHYEPSFEESFGAAADALLPPSLRNQAQNQAYQGNAYGAVAPAASAMPMNDGYAPVAASAPQFNDNAHHGRDNLAHDYYQEQEQNEDFYRSPSHEFERTQEVPSPKANNHQAMFSQEEIDKRAREIWGQDDELLNSQSDLSASQEQSLERSDDNSTGEASTFIYGQDNGANKQGSLANSRNSLNSGDALTEDTSSEGQEGTSYNPLAGAPKEEEMRLLNPNAPSTLINGRKYEFTDAPDDSDPNVHTVFTHSTPAEQEANKAPKDNFYARAFAALKKPNDSTKISGQSSAMQRREKANEDVSTKISKSNEPNNAAPNTNGRSSIYSSNRPGTTVLGADDPTLGRHTSTILSDNRKVPSDLDELLTLGEGHLDETNVSSQNFKFSFKNNEPKAPLSPRHTYTINDEHGNKTSPKEGKDNDSDSIVVGRVDRTTNVDLSVFADAWGSKKDESKDGDDLLALDKKALNDKKKPNFFTADDDIPSKRLSAQFLEVNPLEGIAPNSTNNIPSESIDIDLPQLEERKQQAYQAIKQFEKLGDLKKLQRNDNELGAVDHNAHQSHERLSTNLSELKHEFNPLSSSFVDEVTEKDQSLKNNDSKARSSIFDSAAVKDDDEVILTPKLDKSSSAKHSSDKQGKEKGATPSNDTISLWGLDKAEVAMVMGEQNKDKADSKDAAKAQPKDESANTLSNSSADTTAAALSAAEQAAAAAAQAAASAATAAASINNNKAMQEHNAPMQTGFSISNKINSADSKLAPSLPNNQAQQSPANAVNANTNAAPFAPLSGVMSTATMADNTLASSNSMGLSQYLMHCKAAIATCPYLGVSGLSNEVIESFNLGYDPYFSFDKGGYNPLRSKSTHSYPALIIPLSDDSYVAYNIQSLPSNMGLGLDEPIKNYIGEAHGFNLKALNSIDSDCTFICASEMDALALLSTGTNAVALGTPLNAIYILEHLQKLFTQGQIEDLTDTTFYLALPQHEKFWKDALDALLAGMNAFNLQVLVSDVYAPYKSIHQALIAQGQSFIERVEQLKQVSDIYLEQPMPSAPVQGQGLILSFESLSELNLEPMVYTMSSPAIALSRLVLAKLVEFNNSEIIYAGSKMQWQMICSLLSLNNGVQGQGLASYKARFLALPLDFNAAVIEETLNNGLMSARFNGIDSPVLMIDTFGYDNSLCAQLSPRMAKLAQDSETPIMIWCSHEQQAIFEANALQTIKMQPGSMGEIIFNTLDSSCQTYQFTNMSAMPANASLGQQILGNQSPNFAPHAPSAQVHNAQANPAFYANNSFNPLQNNAPFNGAAPMQPQFNQGQQTLGNQQVNPMFNPLLNPINNPTGNKQ